MDKKLLALADGTNHTKEENKELEKLKKKYLSNKIDDSEIGWHIATIVNKNKATAKKYLGDKTLNQYIKDLVASWKNTNED
jgi:hypothetical protein